MIPILFILFVISNHGWSRPQEEHTQPQAAPQRSSSVTPIPIVSQKEVVGANGSFNFSYETGNGIHFEQGGYIKRVTAVRSQLNAEGSQPADEDIQVLIGSFSYTAPDGQEISVRYTADENGFHPEGDHLPTSPPIPPEIQRSLESLPKEEGEEKFPALAAQNLKAEGSSQDLVREQQGIPRQNDTNAPFYVPAENETLSSSDFDIVKR